MRISLLLYLLPFFFLPAPAQSWDYTTFSGAIFSSPKAWDLNNDHYPDIVIATGNEDLVSTEGILALDGKTGQKLWSYIGGNQLYSSAIFEDINLDGTKDVFLGGRKGYFFCLDGKSGTLIWQFDPSFFGHVRDSGAFNLYTPALVTDQNGDGFRDLVNVYGGGTVQVGNDRPVAWLVLLSGKTGEVLAADTMPDGRESYSSPLVHDFDGDGNPEILFGSGEERRGGKLWRCGLAQLLANDISAAEILAEDSLKGFIAVSSLADFNGDGTVDIAAPALNERLMVIDGKSGQLMYQHREAGYEHYTTPVIGDFTGDSTADIFCSFQKGLWPFYSGYKFVLIDGATGVAVWDSALRYYQLTQFVAMDSDGDQYDELIFCHNSDTGFTTLQYTNQLKLIDFQDDSIYSLLPAYNGLNIFSSPLLSDFDQDGKVEITYAHTLNPDQYYTVDSCRIHHRELGFSAAGGIAWGGYLGNDGDGLYRRKTFYPTGNDPFFSENKILLYPNPCSGTCFIQQPELGLSWEIFDLQGKKRAEGKGSQIELDGPDGSYVVRIFLSGKQVEQQILLKYE